MRNSLILVLGFLCSSFSICFSSDAWPNEPVGSTNVFDCPFLNSTCGLWDVYKSARYSSDATAPLSPIGILDEALEANATTGGGVFAVNLPYVSEFYVGTWWKTNPEFEGMAHSGNKMIFLTGDYDNNFLQWYGPPGQPKQINFAMQSEMNNCHIAGWDGGCGAPGAQNSGKFIPNGPANSIIAAGSGWHRLEVYQKKSTTATSKDGIVRIWIDGALSTNYTNLNLSPTGFNSVQYNHTWDGTIALQCHEDIQPVDQQWRGRDCSRAWHHMWDHLRVSIPNGAPPILMITTGILPARTGSPYLATLAADGGTQPYTWFLESGKLPAGLSLNKAVISGTPTCVGRSDFTIRVTDASQPALTATKSYTIITSGTGTCPASIGTGPGTVASQAQFVAKATSGKVTFTLPLTSSAHYTLSIYSLTGRKTYEHRSLGQKAISFTRNLGTGIYVAKFTQGAQSSTIKFQVMN